MKRKRAHNEQEKAPRGLISSFFPLSSSSGMTLVEMAVVVGIVAIVSSIIVFNYSNFRNNVTIRGLSQDIALSIRKAQTYATSVQSIIGGGSTSDFPAYGISFSINTATSATDAIPSRKRFVLFADVNEDGKYQSGSSCGSPGTNSECVESFGIQSNDRIVEYCYQDGSGSTCVNESSPVSDKTVDIVFDRPAPDGYICIHGVSGCQTPRPAYVDVIVQAISGNYKTITVWNTGQISVE